MSENGPREGTRDLPRPAPDSGRKGVEPDSPAGIAYGSLSRSLRRRRAELAALMEAGGTATAVAEAYQAEHPLEPEVTAAEVDAAVTGAKSIAAGTTARFEKGRRPQTRKSDARA